MIATMSPSRTTAAREYRALEGAGRPIGRVGVGDLVELASAELARMKRNDPRRHTYQAFVARWRQHVATERRKASAARKTRGAGPGRPAGSKSDKPRCPCGAHTLRRAQARAYDCCKAAGLRIVS